MSDTFCPSCGEVLPILEELQRQLREKDRVIRDLQNELTKKVSQIGRMTTDRNAQQELNPLTTDAREVFRYWRDQISPRAREFKGDRFDSVVARLRAGWSVEELKLAIDGAAARPRQGGAPTDLRSICRNEPNLQMFIGWAECKEAERPTPSHLIPRDRLALMQQQIDQPSILDRLAELRGWKPEVVLEMGLGLENGRVIFPVYDADGLLVGVHAYQPNKERRAGPKLIAKGKRDLFPAPEAMDSTTCWLVEGEPDAVAVRSMGFPAVAVPGVAKWEKSWAGRFEHFERVHICFDCDEQGRDAAHARLTAFAGVTDADVVDLEPGREDGYDVGDLLVEHGEAAASKLASAVVCTRDGIVMSFTPRRTESPFEGFLSRLEEHDCRVRRRGPGHASAQCPVHDDRQPSLAVTEGNDSRVLLHCHAGCSTEEIVQILDLSMADLFMAKEAL